MHSLIVYNLSALRLDFSETFMNTNLVSAKDQDSMSTELKDKRGKAKPKVQFLLKWRASIAVFA